MEKDLEKFYYYLTALAEAAVKGSVLGRMLEVAIMRSLREMDVPGDIIPLDSNDPSKGALEVGIDLEKFTNGVIKSEDKLSDDELFVLYGKVSSCFPKNSSRRLKTIRDLQTNQRKEDIELQDLQYKAEQFGVPVSTIYLDGMIFSEITFRIMWGIKELSQFVAQEEIYGDGKYPYGKLKKIFQLLPREDLKGTKDLLKELKDSDSELTQHAKDSIKIANRLFDTRYNKEFSEQMTI